MAIRQPIVSILGHVDHGKTTLLDSIRGTAVAAREAGAITQHIGATEVPVETIFDLCANLGAAETVKIPGLLFIDTPGHHSFTTLRSRGGALADLAVLIVDINEGFKPQTLESIQILRRFKTPFLVAANKIDRIQGWRRPDTTCYVEAAPTQSSYYRDALNERLYALIGEFSNIGMGADIFSNISDFKSSVAIVPVSAREGTGIPELLMVLIGLAQRYLGDRLEREEGGSAEGTILEVKEYVGLGTTLDVIIYKGVMHKGDTVIVGAKPTPLVTKIKALLKPKPLDEIRDPREQFDSLNEVTAAAGIKISAQNLEGAIAGTPIRVVEGDPEPYVEQMRKELNLKVEVVDEGIIVKADAIGSLEALAYEAKAAGIPIKMASTGAVSKRDIIEAATIPNPLYQAVMGFNVPVHPEAVEEMEISGVKLFTGDIVYGLIEEFNEWREIRKREIDSASRKEAVFPGKALFLADHTFRINKPAIVGVRVLGGRLRIGQRLIRSDGKTVGRIRSIRSGDDAVHEVLQGQEVAIAIEGATVGRQLKEEDVLYVDLPEKDARELNGSDNLNFDEQQVLEELLSIKRRDDHFWGR